MDVSELAEQRRHRGDGEQIDGDDEREVLDIGERAADGRQRRRHDGLLQRREEHGEQDADDDPPRQRVVERRRAGGLGRLRGVGCAAKRPRIGFGHHWLVLKQSVSDGAYRPGRTMTMGRDAGLV